MSHDEHDDPRLRWKRAVGTRLREEREKLNLSQTDLARRFSYTKQLCSHWETGRSEIASYDLWLLRSMGFDVVYILLGTRTSAAAAGSSAAQPDQVSALVAENDKLKKLLAAALLERALRE